MKPQSFPRFKRERDLEPELLDEGAFRAVRNACLYSLRSQGPLEESDEIEFFVRVHCTGNPGETFSFVVVDKPFGFDAGFPVAYVFRTRRDLQLAIDEAKVRQVMRT